MNNSEELKGKKSKVNFKEVNKVIKLSHKLLKVVYALSIIASLFVLIKVCEDLKIWVVIKDILSILSPLFIGLIVAWLFNPFVSWLKKKGVKRLFGAIIAYVFLLGVLAAIIGSLMPILYEQIVSFAESIPSIVKAIENALNNFLNRFSHVDGLDIQIIKEKVMTKLDNYGNELAGDLPSYVMSFGKSLFSSISNFGIGLIIGFFILIGFDKSGDTLIIFVPKKYREDVNKLCNVIDGSLRNYVTGVIIDAIVIFVICSIAFYAVGLKAPLLFAVFCAITNVIPYIGPYIGAVPALIVAFSMSPTIGILTGIVILVIQFFEGNFLQEYIMSKTTKLHPVTIIIGLLIFGHFWGMIGMVISTPVIAVLKEFYKFFDDKYDFFNNNNDDDDEEPTISVKGKLKLAKEKTKDEAEAN